MHPCLAAYITPAVPPTIDSGFEIIDLTDEEIRFPMLEKTPPTLPPHCFTWDSVFPSSVPSNRPSPDIINFRVSVLFDIPPL